MPEEEECIRECWVVSVVLCYCVLIVLEWHSCLVERRSVGWSVDGRESRKILIVCHSTDALAVKNKVIDQGRIVGFSTRWKHIVEFLWRMYVFFSTDG